MRVPSCIPRGPDGFVMAFGCGSGGLWAHGDLPAAHHQRLPGSLTIQGCDSRVLA